MNTRTTYTRKILSPIIDTFKIGIGILINSHIFTRVEETFITKDIFDLKTPKVNVRITDLVILVNCAWYSGNDLCCTQRNLFEILHNQTEFRLYIPFFKWFETKLMSVWIQINRCMVNTIWFQIDSVYSCRWMFEYHHFVWYSGIDV